MSRPMTLTEARKVRRSTIRVGRRYEFYSTVRDTPVNGASPSGPFIREHTGQKVKVLEQTFKPGDADWEPGASSRMYLVRADDGCKFLAYREELNGWYKDTRQFYGPAGVWRSAE